MVINSSFGLTLFSVAFYILVVLVGEVLPKALGTRFSVQIALLSVPILRILNTLMRPFIILIEQIFPVITAENEISTDEEEIRQMAKIGSQKGFIEADEAAMIFKVFQLNDLKAKDLMIPRVSAPCLNGSSNLGEISKLIMSDNSPWWVILGVYGALVINSSFGLTLFSIFFYILVVLVGEVLPKALGTRFSVQI